MKNNKNLLLIISVLIIPIISFFMIFMEYGFFEELLINTLNMQFWDYWILLISSIIHLILAIYLCYLIIGMIDIPAKKKVIFLISISVFMTVSIIITNVGLLCISYAIASVLSPVKIEMGG